MKKGKIIILSILILFFVIILILLFLGKSIFLVKNIEINKDFDIDKKKLLNVMGIYPLRSILEYNINDMENELSKYAYLKEYNVSKKYPNTLLIKMKIRKPLAKVVGMKGNIFYIDEQGVIFKEVDNNFLNYPVLLFNIHDNIKYGVKIIGKYKDIIDELSFLQGKYPELFESISQIEIIDNKMNNVDYILYFKTMKQKIYLKNKIDVDSIIKALSCVLLLNNKEYASDMIMYTGNGFLVM